MMATPAEVMKVCAFMAACYPNFKLQKATIDSYSDLFADTDAEILATAAKQSCRGSEYFPTPARLFAAIDVIQATANPIPDHTQAWDELMREVRRVGFMAWSETKFTSELIRDVAKIYWRDACMIDLDQLPTVRAQFRDSYNARAGRQQQQRTMLPGTNALIKQLTDRLDVSKRLLSGGDNNE